MTRIKHAFDAVIVTSVVLVASSVAGLLAILFMAFLLAASNGWDN